MKWVHKNQNKTEPNANGINETKQNQTAFDCADTNMLEIVTSTAISNNTAAK